MGACSPHTRGWTGQIGRLGCLVAVFPAHAGMDRTTIGSSSTLTKCSPHTRGWTGCLANHSQEVPECSPHTRGWTATIRTRIGKVVCSPHTRGWTDDARLASCRALRVPRTRGDGPRSRPRPIAELGCSPHTRGWTVWDQPSAPSVTVFPAHAGMDRSSMRYGRSKRRVPRTRGDGPATAALTLATKGVFPAHAGMDRQRDREIRLRLWCSPHTRGWTEVGDGVCRGHVVFPAHAGMDRAFVGPLHVPTGVPRTRGDGPTGR